jgi:protein-S-isoprenylcysteine O-methyltransferase Ste14
MFPEYINLFGINFSQTLLTSFLSLIFFLIFVAIYNFLKNKNEANFFVAMIDMLIETMDKFF